MSIVDYLKKRIIFFGTSEFAVPALEALIKNGYEIATVITQPDKPAGRKQELLPSPVKQAALKSGLQVLQPENLLSSPLLPSPGEEARRAGEVELFVVVSYGQLIPKSILDLPKFGALNLHPSLLPKYRGASPIHAAILNGDKETGVTLFKLDELLDHGPIVGISKFDTRNSKLYYKDLHDRLAQRGAKLLISTLPDYLAGKINPKPQDDSLATFTKRITKNDGRIDWKKSAKEIDRLVRAYSAWPVAWTTLGSKRLKIFESFLPLPEGRGRLRGGKENKPGEVETYNQQINVRTSTGLLQILSLQLEGRKILSAAAFLRGHPGLNEKVLI